MKIMHFFVMTIFCSHLLHGQGGSNQTEWQWQTLDAGHRKIKIIGTNAPIKVTIDSEARFPEMSFDFMPQAGAGPMQTIIDDVLNIEMATGCSTMQNFVFPAGYDIEIENSEDVYVNIDNGCVDAHAEQIMPVALEGAKVSISESTQDGLTKVYTEYKVKVNNASHKTKVKLNTENRAWITFLRPAKKEAKLVTLLKKLLIR